MEMHKSVFSKSFLCNYLIIRLDDKLGDLYMCDQLQKLRTRTENFIKIFTTIRNQITNNVEYFGMPNILSKYENSRIVLLLCNGIFSL